MDATQRLGVSLQGAANVGDDMSKNEINDDDDFLLDNETNGIGDIRLLATWQWLDTDEKVASLQASIKAQLGDANKFTSSGGCDISLALLAQQDSPLEKGSVSL